MVKISAGLNSGLPSLILLVLCGGVTLNVSGQETGNARGPIIEMPYEIVSGWQQPFQEQGFAFGGYLCLFCLLRQQCFIRIAAQVL